MLKYFTFLITLPLFGQATFTINNPGGTLTNFPQQFAQPFVQGEIATCPQVVLDGTPLTSQANVTERWPDNSVKHAILAVLFQSITTGNHTISYQAQTCSNVALTQAQMLGVNYSFNAQILLTNGTTLTADARAMLTAGDYTVWTPGQIAQTIILTSHTNTLTCNAHPCSTYDIGFDANKSFRPIFHATFWPGINKVFIRYIGESANTETIQDQTYSLTLTAGNTSPTTVYTKASFTHSGAQRWTKAFWQGGAPSGSLILIPNLTYLRTTKFTPYYDTSTPLNPTTATTISNLWSGLSAANRDIGGTGNWAKNMSDAGSRLDIGLYPSWTVDWLYDGRVGLRDSTFGNADLQASWPVHYREGKTGKILNRGDTGSTGIGKVISLSGRPSLCLNPGFINFNATAADTITFVGAVTAQGWNWDAGHVPEGPVIQYILTGDFWYLEESMFWVSFDVAVGYKSQFYRGPTGAEGSLMYQQLRAMAWNLRSLVNLTWIIPDSMPEKTYFRTLIADSVAIEEGIRNVTTGAYNGTTLWNYGRNTMASNGAGTSFDSNGVVSTLHQYVRGSNQFAQDEYGICSSSGAGTPCVPATVSEAAPLFEMDYMLTSLGRCKQLGYLCDGLLTFLSSLYTGMLTDVNFNPYILANGRVPTYKVNGTQFATFVELKTGYNATWQAMTVFSTQGDPDGYLAYATAGVSYLTGETNGTTSWNFLLANGVTQATFSDDPKWNLAPAGALSCSASGSLTNGTVGTSYGTQTILTSNCSGTLTWSVLSGALPGGLSLCGATGLTCNVTGTPTTAGTFSGVIRATDGGSNTALFNFSITISAAVIAPTFISTSPLPNGTNGTAYLFIFTFNGTAPVTCTATGVPAGLTLNLNSCQLSGTPTVTAVNTINVTGTNSAGNTGAIPFSLTIAAGGTAPNITTTCPLTSGSQNAVYSLQNTATGTTPITWNLSVGSLPTGLSINSTGLISGTPTGSGNSIFTLRAVNAVGNNTKSCSLNIAATVPTMNYSITTVGPHHVTQGHYMFFNIFGTLISGNDEEVTPLISGLPANTTVTYPNQIAVCCGPRAPGVQGNNPVKIATTSITPAGTYALTIQYTSFVTNVVRNTSYTLIVDPPPVPLSTQAFPVDVALTGLATYNANMISFGATYCTPPLGGPAFEGFVWYYDGPRVMFQNSDYTGDPAFTTCAIGLNALYQTYVLNNSGNIPGYHVFPKGLAMDFIRNNNPNDKTALTQIQTSGYANVQNIAPVIDWLLSREMSYGLETNLEQEGLGVARITPYQDVVEILIGHFDQWFLSKTANYVQPFMVALACEALIQYWEVSNDARVPPLIKAAADQLYSVSWDTIGPTNSFLYYNYNAALGPPPPQPYPYDPMCANYASFTVTCRGPSPDLNLLIVPIYGWVYQRTGDVSYRTKGDIIFNNGVSGAFIGAGKQYSQNYRWSGRYLIWRISGVPTITSTTLPNGINGTPYSFQLVTTGSPTCSGTGFPTWMSIDPVTCIISGTPDANGTTNVTIAATNTNGTTGPIPFSITVDLSGVAPIILTTMQQFLGGAKNVPYSFQFTASGTDPKTWAVTGLPTNITLDTATGIISGTALVSSTSSLVVTATNAFGTSPSKSFTLVISGGAPTITSLPVLPQATFGQPYSYTLTITGDLPITCSATGLAGWMSFNTSTCTISGTPNANGTTTIAISATNAIDTDGPHNYSLTVFQVLPGNIRFSSPVIFSGGVIH